MSPPYQVSPFTIFGREAHRPSGGPRKYTHLVGQGVRLLGQTEPGDRRADVRASAGGLKCA